MSRSRRHQPFSLLFMLLRFGRLRHSGRDFNRERNEALEELGSYRPPRNWFANLTRISAVKALLMRNPYLRMIVTQASFVKNSLTPHGGHLHAPFLNVSYIRIPKSASTSLSWLILQAIYPDLAGKNLRAREINFLADANIRRVVSTDDASDIFFTVVRNPFERIVSVYRDFLSTHARDIIYDDYLFGMLRQGISFGEFIDRVETIPDVLKDPHLKPQHHFIEFYRRRNPNIVVLHLEKPEEIKYFLFIYNLEMPTLNASDERYDYRDYYDVHSVETVSRIYKRDITMFGYEPMESSLKRYVSGKNGASQMPS